MNMTTIDYRDTGKTGVYYLKKIWFHYQCLRNGESTEQTQVHWNYINATLNLLGLGTEPTMKYLIGEAPNFETFEDWVIENGRISPELIQQFNTVVSGKFGGDISTDEPAVLSEADLQHWDKKGYVIIKNAISREDCAKTAELVYATIEASPDKPETWYAIHPRRQGIMVQLFQHELLDKNRLNVKIRRAYEQIWKRKDLLVSMDRVSFNPPETATYHFPGPRLHWDVSLRQPIPFGLQGILYLVDTEKTQGAFTLIPGFHNKIESWLDNLPEGTDPRGLELLKDEVHEPIGAEAGDFVIWDQRLPHGSSPNSATRPRIVQYINYQPIDINHHEEWI